MGYLDDEVARIENDPTYSVADSKAANSWKITWESRWTGQVQDRIRQSQEANKAKRSELYVKIRDIQKAVDSDKAAADVGDIGHTELMTRRRLHAHRMQEIERRYEALENSDSLIASMAGDPVGFMDNFYEKWTSLRDRRPQVDEWIAEDRQKRGRP